MDAPRKAAAAADTDPTGVDAYQRMHKLLELKAQLEQLHAHLEYVRLMLRIRAAQP
ncbi:MAG: hypothetical protein KGL18_15985 [Burkholderiales bacterium]|nr:hypothetical protein [Burkholderiales bacterium]MDE1928667.1 hypothetical protein [Burkholderiales bacterium]MDE2159625.1 hypothetical protein [Burkholderiales bacterium]MDE2504464.1 hypothetical protein [Burkholderiales bacterium]